MDKLFDLQLLDYFHISLTLLCMNIAVPQFVCFPCEWSAKEAAAACAGLVIGFIGFSLNFDEIIL
jgi:hypothetical protein